MQLPLLWSSKVFSSVLKETLYLVSSYFPIPSLLQPLETISLYLSLWISLCWIFHVNIIISQADIYFKTSIWCVSTFHDYAVTEWVINHHLVNDCSAVGLSPLIFSPINQCLLTSVQLYFCRWVLLGTSQETFTLMCSLLRVFIILANPFHITMQPTRCPSPADASPHGSLATASPVEPSRASY